MVVRKVRSTIVFCSRRNGLMEPCKLGQSFAEGLSDRFGQTFVNSTVLIRGSLGIPAAPPSRPRRRLVGFWESVWRRRQWVVDFDPRVRAMFHTLVEPGLAVQRLSPGGVHLFLAEPRGDCGQ